MRFAPGALVLFLAATRAAAQEPSPQPASTPSPTPAASPSPSPTPLYRFLPYWYEGHRDLTPSPLLRFEDKAEVRALEMNAAIARFFDSSEEKGDMLRGATPGGAPTLGEMAPYRPHVSPSLSLLGLAFLAGKEIHKRWKPGRVDKGEALLRELLLNPPPSPSPSPAPSASPSPTPPGSPPGL